MSSQAAEIIYPCPFSRDYGIPKAQAWRYLWFFWSYRLLVGLYFVAILGRLLGPFAPLIGAYELFRLVSLSYFALTLLAAPMVAWRSVRYAHLAQIFVFTDIVALSLLTFACGGVVSGIGALLAVSLAAAGLMIGGRCAVLFAALATLGILSQEVLLMQMQVFNASAIKYSGLLGSSFFAITLLMVGLAQRVEQTTRLTKQHVRTIVRLEELNRYIIEHLQTGVLIVDSQQQVILFNPSLMQLAALEQPPEALSQISAELMAAFQAWRQEPGQSFALINLPNRFNVPVRFSSIVVRDELLFIIILEDNTLYNQRLQQSKLASLGRLTASIAHEVRNPLSAISHAAQLLSETPELSAQDLRLTEIIKNHSDRVNIIIEDILKLSRRNDSSRQNIALNAWLVDYVDEQNALNRDYNQPFELETVAAGLHAYIDGNHLKQILDNLCSNALRYGRPDLGKIRLRVQLIDNVPCVAVLDHGPGVDRQHVGNLFEPFFTTSHQGTGLGLYICRELAQLNQAELNYFEQDGQHYFQLMMINADQVVIEL